MTPTLPTAFEDATAAWSKNARSCFKDMRSIILETASDLPDLTLLETLKWGQPSWLPDRPRIGSTLRAGWSEAHPNRISLYVHCQTTLAETMRNLYPNSFTYEGNRALHMDLTAALPEQAIAHCASLTLTYHRRAA